MISNELKLLLKSSLLISTSFFKAMEEMNGKDLEGENIEIVFAKPPDQKRKERKAQRQAAKNQM